MRNNEEKRFQPSSRSLRCIFILPRYIFHRRYRLENPARHCWRVVASLRRKNVAAAVSLLLARNSTDDHAVRTPICTVVHKTDGIPRSRHHTVETNSRSLRVHRKMTINPCARSERIRVPRVPPVLIPSSGQWNRAAHLTAIEPAPLNSLVSITRKRCFLTPRIVYSDQILCQKSNVEI